MLTTTNVHIITTSPGRRHLSESRGRQSLVRNCAVTFLARTRTCRPQALGGNLPQPSRKFPRTTRAPRAKRQTRNAVPGVRLMSQHATSERFASSSSQHQYWTATPARSKFTANTREESPHSATAPRASATGSRQAPESHRPPLSDPNQPLSIQRKE